MAKDHFTIRTRRSLQLLSGLVAACGFTLAFSTQVFAASLICEDGGACMDRPAVNGGVQIDNGYEYTIHTVTHVSGPGETPFTPGSGYNGKYNGDAVYEFQDPSNTGNCIRENQGDTTLTFGGCGARAYFIQDGSDHLISVGATNDSGQNSTQPAIAASTSNTSHGSYVYLTQIGDPKFSDQVWSL